MGWRLRISDKTVRKFAELPIYCQRQNCSSGNVVFGSIRFMQIFAGVRWTGGVKWEWGSWKWRFSLHSFTVVRTLHTWPHDIFQVIRPWAYFKVIGLFHIKFLKNGAWYGKRYYRQLIGNHTLAFDWCHFWWPWSTFESHFSLGCHFHVHFSNPWHAFASHGLAAIAELLVLQSADECASEIIMKIGQFERVMKLGLPIFTAIVNIRESIYLYICL